MILVPLAGGSPVALSKAVMFFGRGNECDIVLAHSRKISRKHCCIAQIDDNYLVRDLGSMNGVRVNGEKAEPELPLRPGDEVTIGDVSFRFQPVQQAATETLTESINPLANKGVVNRMLQSTDLPVAIPEEDVDFIVEQTGKIPHVPYEEMRLDADEDFEEADEESEE